MPYISALFHLVWSTKNREPLLRKEIRRKVFDHIKENAKKKGIYLDRVNGHIEHVHCILSLSSDQTISKTLQLLKGESSWWINKEKLCNSNFEWQDDYFAASFNQSDLEKVRAYIDNQEEHHRKKTFQEEYEEFLREYGFEYVNGKIS